MLKRYYCNSKECSRRDECNHSLLEGKLKNDILFYLIGEDLHDICCEVRLFEKDNNNELYLSKETYIKILEFEDNICSKKCEECSYHIISSKSKAKCVNGNKCSHPQHPINIDEVELQRVIKKTEELLKNLYTQPIKYGSFETDCPSCDGKFLYSIIDGKSIDSIHPVCLNGHCNKCDFSIMT